MFRPSDCCWRLGMRAWTHAVAGGLQEVQAMLLWQVALCLAACVSSFTAVQSSHVANCPAEYCGCQSWTRLPAAGWMLHALGAQKRLMVHADLLASHHTQQNTTLSRAPEPYKIGRLQPCLGCMLLLTGKPDVCRCPSPQPLASSKATKVLSETSRAKPWDSLPNSPNTHAHKQGLWRSQRLQEGDDVRKGRPPDGFQEAAPDELSQRVLFRLG